MGDWTPQPEELWIVEALDERAGSFVVGVFSSESMAEQVALAVPEPWAVMVRTAEMNVLQKLPVLADAG